MFNNERRMQLHPDKLLTNTDNLFITAERYTPQYCNSIIIKAWESFSWGLIVEILPLKVEKIKYCGNIVEILFKHLSSTMKAFENSLWLCFFVENHLFKHLNVNSWVNVCRLSDRHGNGHGRPFVFLVFKVPRREQCRYSLRWHLPNGNTQASWLSFMNTESHQQTLILCRRITLLLRSMFSFVNYTMV